jgi:DNA polymerase III alpha subunit
MKLIKSKKSRKKKFNEPNYSPTGYPAIDDAVRENYGTLPFQENCMTLFANVTQQTFGHAESVRKMIGKKLNPNDPKAVAMYNDMISKWNAGGKAQGIPQDILDEWWSKLEANSGYSFNRSHSVSYSILTYECLWYLKNEPLAYCSAMITVKPQEFSKWASLLSQHGYSIKVPNVNESKETPVINSAKTGILLPLSAIDGIGGNAQKKILDNAPYHSLEDFAERSSANVAVKCKLFALGAFDGIEGEFDDLKTKLDYQKLKGWHLFQTRQKTKRDGTMVKAQEKYKFKVEGLDVELLSMVIPTPQLASLIQQYSDDGYQIFTILDIGTEDRVSQKGNSFVRYNYYTEKTGGDSRKPVFYMNKWAFKELGINANTLQFGNVVAVKLTQYKSPEQLYILR